MRTLTISGNLGKDPQITTTNSGTQVANFSIAVKKNRADSNGEYGSDWIRCALFGKRVAVIQQFFHKGSHVVVSGDLEISQYTNNDGVTKTQVGMIVTGFDLPDNNKPQQEKQADSDNPFANNGQSIDIDDDDLPF